MTTCYACGVPCARLVTDATGSMCIACEDCAPPVAYTITPRRLADSSHQGNQPLTDFADHVGVNAAREIEVATARAEGAIEVVRCLVQAFERELAGGYATHEQQQALRRARALIAEGRKR